MLDVLISKLLATPGVTGLCGSQIRPLVRAPDDVGSSLVLTDVSREADLTHAGPSGLIFNRVQIDCWATSWAGADDLRSAVVALLEGAAFEHGGLSFQLIHQIGQRGSFEDTDGGRLFRSSLDFAVWHSPL